MRLLLRTIAVLIIFMLAAVVGVNMLLVAGTRGLQYDNINQLPRNKVGLLLGTTKHNPATGKVLVYYDERVKAAARLYQAGKVEYILASSDNGETKNAETLAKDLVALGVPGQRIIIDRYGKRTFHSVLRCKTYIRKDSVTIITQKRHGKRALYIARHQGMAAIAYAANGDEQVFDLQSLFHEQVARLRMIKDLLTKPPEFILAQPLKY